MNLIRRNNSLQPRDLFSGVMSQFLRDFSDESSDVTAWNPAVDVREDKNQYLVCADLPGVEKKDIHLSLENNTLIIRGERHYEFSEDKEGFSRTERLQGQFYRRFVLPETTDESHIQAKYKKGVLEISIPKKANAKAKEIQIRVED